LGIVVENFVQEGRKFISNSPYDREVQQRQDKVTVAAELPIWYDKVIAKLAYFLWTWCIYVVNMDAAAGPLMMACGVPLPCHRIIACRLQPMIPVLIVNANGAL